MSYQQVEQFMTGAVSKQEETNASIWTAILNERTRQTQKWGHTSFESVARYVLNERGLPGDDLPDDLLKFIGLRTMEVVLSEEVGEVSRAILENDFAGLEKELIQVAAVAVAMVEYLRLDKSAK